MVVMVSITVAAEIVGQFGETKLRRNAGLISGKSSAIPSFKSAEMHPELIRTTHI